MKRAMLLLAVACCWTRDARAQITVSGSPAQMKVSAATAGLAPTAVSNSLTTFSVTKPALGKSRTITAHINAAMPAGVTLQVTFQSAGNGSSNGGVALSTTAQDVITGITARITGATITYQLSASVAAGVVPLQTRIVTFTAITTP